MKYRLLEFLKDPVDMSGFKIDVFEFNENNNDIKFDIVQCKSWCYMRNQDVALTSPDQCAQCYNHEILAGKLVSQDGAGEYPIVGGVPRILPAPLLADRLKKKYVDFIQKYGDRFTASDHFNYEVESQKKMTLDSFGYQWNTFEDNYDYFKNIFLSFTRPFMEEVDFKGKVCLEVGCGSGRPAVTACRMGAEVIGMDISEAVDAAYSQTKNFPLLHVVQGDAYHPPFFPSFDVIYSVGVLQHIPSPEKALLGMHNVVSGSSPLILWVYGKREFWYQPIEWLRVVTRRLPFGLLRIISVFLAFLSEVFLLIPYRLMRPIPMLKKIANKVPGRIYADYPFRENILGWFDRLQAPVTYYFEKEEITNLLEKTGYKDIEVYARPDASASWVIKVLRK